jgi:DNA-directed RNA polymerase specialized sigma24 family protein
VEVLVLRDIQELDYAEIALLMDLHRARSA